MIRGQVSVDGAISYGSGREGEGVTVHDSRGGALAGLRWTGREPEFRGGGWVPFELIRPFPAPGEEDEPLVVFLQLHGLGVAKFRNLEVDVLDLDPAADKVAEAPPPAPAAPPTRLLDRIAAPFRR